MSEGRSNQWAEETVGMIHHRRVLAQQTLLEQRTKKIERKVTPETKGDLVSSSGSKLVRVPVGANGRYLTGDSTASGGLSWQAVTNAIAFVSAAQNQTTSGSFQVIALDGEQDDTGTMHDTVTNNSRIVAPTAGLYLVAGGVVWGATSGATASQIRLNAAGASGSGTRIVYSPTVNGVTGTLGGPAGISRPYRLAANDYIEIFAYQISGGSLAYQTGADMTWLSLTKIGA